MVHEDFHVQVGVVIAIHGKSARLRQGIDDRRVSVVVAVALHATVAEATRGLQGRTVQDNLVYCSIVIVEARQRPDSAIHHRTVEPCRLASCNAGTESLHFLPDAGRTILEGLLMAAVPETYNTP